MKRERRFWLIYGAAWLPYAASYVAVFTTHVGSSFAGAVTDAVYNTAPAALFGVGVIFVCRRFPWSHERGGKFFAAHAGLAVLYSALWVSSVPLLFTLEAGLRRGVWSYQPFIGYAFQWEFFAGLMLYGTITSVIYAGQASERLRVEEARAARAEHLRTRAELNALRAQLNPHFLFNTLHSLMALVRHDPPAAEDALERLSALLRYVLKVKRDEVDETDEVSLADEWEFARNYLALEQLRLGGRLRVTSDIQPETLDRPVPAFTLQALIENAVKHGVAPRAEGGLLHVASDLDNGTLRLSVRDDGPGTTTEGVMSSAGLGLRVVRQRLQTRYGGRAGFDVETSPGAGFTVRVRVPSDAEPRARPRGAGE
ncbi:MAG TPA: histidine kinase [Pyrinomonadaceae bacterium]|jgi:signal transduction histidine kinase|nr:histidine kinase [Pyrinomonadaceae bacterium]